MTTEACTSFALTAGWTDATASQTITGGNYTGDFWVQQWPTWPTYPGWWEEKHYHHYHHYTPYLQPLTIERDVKVVLKFSEVDRLRKAAQKDEKLKAVLEKLTPCIEVVVDLDTEDA